MDTARVVYVAGRGAAAALVLFGALSTPALAALWMQISVNPPAPTAGQSVQVTVLTFSATQNLCWDDPRITPIPVAKWYSGGNTPTSLALEMVVLNSSQSFTVPLVQRPGNGAYWDATITFPSGGDWQLYAREAGAPPNPTSADSCVGSVRTIGVQPMGPVASSNTGGGQGVANPASFPGFLIAGALVLAIVAAGGLGVLVISRRRR
jgi:hypothetical protein